MSEPAPTLELLDGRGAPSAADWVCALWPRVAAADLALREPLRGLPARGREVRLLRLGGVVDAGGDARACGDLTIPELLLLTLDERSAFPSLAIVGTGPVAIADGGMALWSRRPAVLDRLRVLFLKAWEAAAPPQAGGVGVAAGRAVARAVREPKPESDEPVTGALAYARVMWLLFGDHAPPKPDEGLFDLTAFQAEAVRRAERALDLFGGVLVADSVGLGKTFVGLALVERALRAGDRVLVVTPAALRRDWHRELAALAPVLPEAERAPWSGSRRRLAPAGSNLELRLEEARPAYAPRLTWVSTERLGLRAAPPGVAGPYRLVLVDEAHQFRNPATRRYRTLAGLARGARVALLTATPVNNTPRDLLHLLELFAGPGDFRDLGVSDLRVSLRSNAAYGEDVRALLGTVVIRRTRPFIAARYRAVAWTERDGRRRELRFPRRAPPQAVPYDLAGTYGRLYDGLEDEIAALRFAALEPWVSTRSVAGTAVPILRILLLKRLESSVEALRRSVARQIAFHVEVERALRSGRRLSRTTFRELFERGEERDDVQLALGAVLPDLGSTAPARAWLDAVAADHAALRRIHAALAALPPERDGKLAALRRVLQSLRGEKVLLFTEFRDTARYLFREFHTAGGVAQIDHARAVVSGEASGTRVDRRWVIDHFAPQANGAPDPPARERVDLLIATDVLSEGLNLQDARHVISYDLPWNPVRLIQRAGRIDRLGSAHEIVVLHHFLPEAGLERLLGLLEVLRAKLRAIERTVGLETSLGLGTAQPPTSLGTWLERLAAGDATALDEIERADAEPFEWEERAQSEFERWREGREAVVASARALRDGAVAHVAAPGPAAAVFYYRAEAQGQRARDLWLVADVERADLRVDRTRALEILLRARDRPRAEGPGPRFTETLVTARAAARAWIDACRASAIAPDRIVASTPQGRALRWLAALARASSVATLREIGPELDRLRLAFSRRQTRGLELSLERVVDRLPHPPSPDGLDLLARFLADHAEWRPGDPRASAVYELREVCMLELVPESLNAPGSTAHDSSAG